MDIKKKFLEMKIWSPEYLSEATAKHPNKKLHFDLHLAEHCNLNCKGCNHLSPLAEPEFSNIKVIENDFERIRELFAEDMVEYILLLGGEPLLAPIGLLTETFLLGRKYFPKTNLILLTNGLLLPKMKDAFWSSCKDNVIKVQITKYPIKFDYENLLSLCKKNGIECEFDLSGEAKDSFRYIPIDIKGLHDITTNFYRCKRGNSCIILKEGKLFTCTIPAVVHHFNKFFNYNFEVSEDDYVDIYKERSALNILKRLSEPIPFCRYCDIDGFCKEFKWEISSRDIKEWT